MDFLSCSHPGMGIVIGVLGRYCIIEKYFRRLRASINQFGPLFDTYSRAKITHGLFS